MRDHFTRLTGREAPEPGEITINGRELPVVGRAGDLVWFDFATLCETPRSTSDFSEIADEFRTVMLGPVPVLDRHRDDAARRLVNLVDELYDRRVKLIVSAAAPAEALYAGERLAFEFRRTASRLAEMRTHDYLASGRPARGGTEG